MSDVAQALDTNGRPAFDVVRQGPSELVLRGELDLSTVPVFRAALSEVPITERVTLDLAELTFIDSTGIHALVQYAREVDGGAPLTLANVDGRFYELYVADDDRSYFDALLVGQRIYRRDLVSGDSVEVFVDDRVAEVARDFAKAHPEERPLAPHEVPPMPVAGAEASPNDFELYLLGLDEVDLEPEPEAATATEPDDASSPAPRAVRRGPEGPLGFIR